MSPDGSVWQTWDAPFGDVEAWLQSAESLLNDLGDEMSGEIQLVFVAEGRAGTQRSQLPKRLNGRKRQSAGAGVFGGGATAPLQAMYDAQAKTVERTLQTANVQLEVLTRTVETQARANGELLEYIRAANEQSALAASVSQQVSSKISDALGELMQSAPLLIELLVAKQKGKQVPASSVKESLVSAATDAVADGVRVVTEKLKGE